jgi:hypothetical protein
VLLDSEELFVVSGALLGLHAWSKATPQSNMTNRESFAGTAARKIKGHAPKQHDK